MVLPLSNNIQNQPMSFKQRIPLFDIVRGFLIITVLVGHLLLGEISENNIKYLIYYFHMPLFLGITGYFISESTLQLSLYGVFKKYRNRLIIPFVLASIVYSLVNSILINKSGILGFIKQIFFPYQYYHLWYIPAILLFIIYLKGLRSLYQKGYTSIVLLILVVSVALTIFFESYSQWTWYEHRWYRFCGDKRFYYFFSYFALGYIARYASKANILALFSLSSLVAWVGLCLMNLGGLAIGLERLLFNFSLISLVVYLANKPFNMGSEQNLCWRVLASMGRLSLPIYLWHVLPLVITYEFFPKNFSLYYLSSTIGLCLVVILTLYGENKHPWIDRVIYGHIQKKQD